MLLPLDRARLWLFPCFQSLCLAKLSSIQTWVVTIFSSRSRQERESFPKMTTTSFKVAIDRPLSTGQKKRTDQHFFLLLLTMRVRVESLSCHSTKPFHWISLLICPPHITSKKFIPNFIYHSLRETSLIYSAETNFPDIWREINPARPSSHL